MSKAIAHRRFTADEYHRMAEAGILHEDDRVELIEGEIVEMSPIGNRHAACVNRLTAHFVKAVGDAAVVSPQNPIAVNEHSEPQPDIALLAPRDDYYASGHPSASDVLLLIEVADASLHYDRSVKIPLYARAGIREVWLIDLERRVIEVHREPRAGNFTSVTRHSSGDLAPSALPFAAVVVSDILV